MGTADFHGGGGEGGECVVGLIQGVVSGEGGGGEVAAGLLLVVPAFPAPGEVDGLQQSQRVALLMLELPPDALHNSQPPECLRNYAFHVQQDALDGWTSLGVLLQHLPDHLLQLLGVQERQGRSGALSDLQEDGLQVLAQEGRDEGGHLIEGTPQRPNIRARTVWLITPNFGTGVVGGACLGAAEMRGGGYFGDVEVSQLGSAVLGEEYVGGFDVAVQYALCVQHSQGQCKLSGSYNTCSSTCQIYTQEKCVCSRFLAAISAARSPPSANSRTRQRQPFSQKASRQAIMWSWRREARMRTQFRALSWSRRAMLSRRMRFRAYTQSSASLLTLKTEEQVPSPIFRSTWKSSTLECYWQVCLARGWGDSGLSLESSSGGS